MTTDNVGRLESMQSAHAEKLKVLRKCRSLPQESNSAIGSIAYWEGFAGASIHGRLGRSERQNRATRAAIAASTTITRATQPGQPALAQTKAGAVAPVLPPK
jgi:hypothetical protein